MTACHEPRRDAQGVADEILDAPVRHEDFAPMLCVRLAGGRTLLKERTGRSGR